MFKSITYIGCDSEGQYTYQLEDSGFVCDLLVPRYRDDGSSAVRYGSVWRIIALTAGEYKRRNFAVAKNLALLLSLFKKNGWDIDSLWLENNRYWLDERYPELEYGSKYYRCVCRQLKQLSYGK
jgi:hypothetical protein